MAYKTSNMQKAKKIIEKNSEILVIDVRDKSEHAQKHIKNSINIPLDEISKMHKAQEFEKYNVFEQSQILVYCQSGNRSKTACIKLDSLGFKDVSNIGGIMMWSGETTQSK